MKSKLFISSFFLLLALVSCNDDFLEKEPLDKLSETNVWEDINLAEFFVNGIYTGVLSGFERGELMATFTDEAQNTFLWAEGNTLLYNTSSLTPTTYPRYGVFWVNPPPYWNHCYANIRKCNIFLENIDNMEGEEERKNRLKGEVTFLRAYFYHELTRNYGGVPIIKESQGLEDLDAILVSRDSYDDCVTFIANELTEAAALLPTTQVEVGRVTEGAANALKGRVLLYAERWTESAAASKVVMESGVHELFPDYEEMFWEENDNNSEMIFSRQHLADLMPHAFNQRNATIGFGGWGGASPSQNLVDMYETTDGLSIEDPNSVYDPNDPFENRDPRFYASILFDNVMFAGREIELHKGGLEGVDGGPNGTNTDATATGYSLRKFVDADLMGGNLGNGGNDWPVIRYGEVLLNYAEAQNELAGPDASVYDAINRLRARPSVNMPPLPLGLSKDQMRERIRNERAVELAFEDHRFYDVRRWDIAQEVLNVPIRGMRIVETPTDTTFTVFDAAERLYNPEDYYMPIPLSEMDKNPNLVQNSGY